MRTHTAAILAVVGLSVAAPAQAMTPYGAASGSFIYYDERGLDDPTGFIGVRGALGLDLNRWIGFEVQAGGATHDQKVDASFGNDIKFRVREYYGGYLKLNAPLSERFSIFALFGYAKSTIKASFGGGSATDSDADFSSALGMRIRTSDKVSLVFDLGSLHRSDDVVISQVSAGVRLDFGGSPAPLPPRAATIPASEQAETPAPATAAPPPPQPVQSAFPTARTVNAAPLKASPQSQSATLLMVPVGSTVEIKGGLSNSEGAWSFVRAGEREGWVTGSALAR